MSSDFHHSGSPIPLKHLHCLQKFKALITNILNKSLRKPTRLQQEPCHPFLPLPSKLISSLFIQNALQRGGSPEPKSRKAFETCYPAWCCRLRTAVPQNPKAERHLRPFPPDHDYHLNFCSPEPKSRKAFETTIRSTTRRTSASSFPRTQKPKGI